MATLSAVYTVHCAFTAADEITVTISLDGSTVATQILSTVVPSGALRLWFTRDEDFDPSSASYSAMSFHGSGQRSLYQVDMNPAHIIRECLTDPDWGMGYPEAAIDDTEFAAAADTLFDEGMGISLLWDQQATIEDFIKLILQHIDAALFVDRSSGLFVLKLIRPDYDIGDLPVLDESHVVRIEGYKVPTLGEMVNYVTVNYWDAITGEDASLSLQDPALASLQGGTISATSNYPGFTNGTIAAQVCARDLRSLSTPLASCTIIADRTAASLNVGEPFVLNWGDLGISELVMRVTSIGLGDGKNNAVTLTCVQDVFGLPEALYTPPSTGWTDPRAEPVECPHRSVMEAPYYELVRQQGQTSVDAELASVPEAGYLMAMGDTPTGDAINMQIEVDAGAGYVAGPMAPFCPSGLLTSAVGPTDTEIALGTASDLDQVTTGTYALLDDEIVRIDAISDTGATIGRGCLDTVPTSHDIGAVLFCAENYAGSDNVEYVSGETIEVKLLPVTGIGQLALADATEEALEFSQRALRPYAPGQVKVNDEYYPETIGGSDAFGLAWVGRDRTQQTGGDLLDYTYGNVGPESGTTYTLRLYDETDTLQRTVDPATSPYSWDTETEDCEIVGGPPVDAYFSDVVLLLHMGGTDGSTTFTDEKGHTVTANGDAQIDTAQSKFGGASALFDGSGDYLSVADSADFEFGSSDFTIDGWVRLHGYATLNGSHYGSAVVAKDAAGDRGFTFSVDGTASSFTTLYF